MALEARDITFGYQADEPLLSGVSLCVEPWERVALSAPSGAGKTTLCRILAGELRPWAGEVTVDGVASMRHRAAGPAPVQLIRQHPEQAFDPLVTLGRSLDEVRPSREGSSALERDELMDRFGVARAWLARRPHELSGGLKQRAMIAMALMCKPSILIADEPTTALDVTIQSQILDLMKDIRKEFGTSIMWISHDLGVVAGLADTVNVMYAGMIVESADVDELYYNPLHPYTKGLLGSLPSTDIDNDQKRLKSIGGYPPILSKKIEKCPFADRCSEATDICRHGCPSLSERTGQHYVACFNV